MKKLVLPVLIFLTVFAKAQENPDEILDIDFFGDQMAVVSRNATLKVYNVTSMKLIYEKKQKDEENWEEIKYSHDGKYLIGKRSMICDVLDVNKGKLLRELDGKYFEVMDFNVRPDRNEIVTYGDQILVWNLETGKSAGLDDAWANDVRISKTGLVYVYNDGNFSSYKPEQTKKKTKFSLVSKKEGFTDTYNFQVINNDENILFTGSEKLELREASDLSLVYEKQIDNLFNTIEGGTNGDQLIAMSIGYRVPMSFRRIEMKSGEILKEKSYDGWDFGWYADAMRTIPGTNQFVTGHPNGSLNVLDAETLEVVKELERQDTSISAMEVSSDGTLLVIGTEEGKMLWFDTKSWSVKKEF